MEENPKNETESGDQLNQLEDDKNEFTDEKKGPEEGTEAGKKDESASTESKKGEKVKEESPTHSGSKKKRGWKKRKIVELPTEEKEGTSTAHSDEGDQEEHSSKARVKHHSRREPRKIKTLAKQSKPKSGKRINKLNENPRPKKKSQIKPVLLSDSTSDEEKPTTNVKQFSFPEHKILSGATVAAVKMRSQKLAIRRTIDENDDSKHWAVGLFQPTKMSLKLRLIRLLLVWLFFRVLNKQTGWLSDKLGVGMMDEPVRPPPRPQPGERYIKVFHESSPHPIHVRVRKPPGTGPD